VNDEKNQRRARVQLVRQTIRALHDLDKAEEEVTIGPYDQFVKHAIVKVLHKEFRRLNGMVAMLAMEST
jgi:hypothetical protein